VRYVGRKAKGGFDRITGNHELAQRDLRYKGSVW
jgi:hypothetical protein